MRLSTPRFASCQARLLFAITLALALAATQVAAQYGAFSSAFEGELWGVRQNWRLADNGEAGGLAYVNGTLFVADKTKRTVVAYDSAGAVVTILNAEWDKSADSLSPAFGLTPGEILPVTVAVNGVGTTAILVSDARAHRVLAFSTAGSYLFTLQLDRTGFSAAVGAINGLATGPGAQFALTTSGAVPTLALQGSFAAGWTNQWESAGAVLAYRNQAAISYNPAERRFEPTPTATLDGTEGNVTPPGQLLFGMVFDPAGNLYTIDTNTERLNVYDPAFGYLFTFGTPVVDGTLAEFAQPYGIAYSPANGGRLLIGDSDRHRVVIYRPNLANNTLDFVSSIEAFGDGLPRSVAIDPATGKLAVSGAYSGSVWVLETPNVAAFNLQVLNAAGAAIDFVCAGDAYKVRFSLTVPAGRPSVTGVVPQLSIDGGVVAVAPIGSGTYGNRMRAGEVATYTYDLLMPTVVPLGSLVLTAGATASTPNVLFREGLLSVANCVGLPPSITATPNIPTQVSGWTPVVSGQTFELTLTATDDAGVSSIEYQITGQNNPGITLPPVTNPTPGRSQTLVLPLPETGFSRITYRATDSDNRKSAWQEFNLRSVNIVDLVSVESDSIAFTVGYPIGIGYRFRATGLPPGATINEATGQISGILGYDSAGSYAVEVTEDRGPSTVSSSVGFNWTIVNVNRPPLVQQPGSIEVVEGQPFQFQVVASDPDGDPVWYSIVGIGQDLPGGISIDAGTGLISGTLGFDSRRDYTIQIGVSECGALAPRPPCEVVLPGSRLATVVNSSLSVLNVNRRPSVVNPGNQANTQGDAVILSIIASDPDVATDGQVLSYSADALPPGLSINSGTGVISGTISYNTAPTYAVTVRVDDGFTNPPSFVVFNWLVSNLNGPPAASAVDRTNAETDNVSFTIASATDPDGDALTYLANGLPAGISIHPTTGVISGTLGYTTAGTYPVSVTVSDGSLSATATFTWTITNTNAPVVVINPGPRANAEGDPVAVAIVASDVDGQPLTYTASGLPTGLVINGSTGVVTGSLGYDTAGTYTVTVSVSDGVTPRSVTFTWTVSNTNRPPTAVADAATVAQAQSVVISVLTNDTDPDGTASLSVVSVTVPASGTAVLNADRTITYTANATFAGATSFSYTISDGGFTSTALVSVQVLSNRPPVCSATASAGHLWPPNHKPSYVSLSGITDPDGGVITVRYTSILQDEPIDSVGQGNTPGHDGGIEDNGARAWVRSERTGNPSIPGDGRVYLIGYTATDAAGASCTGTAELGLPHDQRGTPAVLSPGRWNSLNGQLAYAPPPSAVNDVVTVKKGKSVSISVLGNDQLFYQPVSVTIVGQPAIGSATTNGQTITFQAPSTTGFTTLAYRVTGPFGTATATVTITIS